MTAAEHSPPARIELNGEFSATDLDDIIRQLAGVRAGMQPAVSIEPPSEHSPDTEVLEQQGASVIFRTRAGGGLRIWLRNEGLGWLAFTLDASAREGFREFLGKEVGHTYRTH